MKYVMHHLKVFLHSIKKLFLLFHLYLHSDYAVAKECVTEEAKTGCAIGQYINRDLFNPFCTYNTDPPLNSSSINEFIKHFKCFRLIIALLSLSSKMCLLALDK